MTRKAMAPIATFLLVAFANPSEAKRPPTIITIITTTTTVPSTETEMRR
jgi:hypothetical protein